MRALLTIIISVILVSVTGCGHYILKTEIKKKYIPIEIVQRDYILKSEVAENYIPKTEVRTFYAPIASNHKCRYRINSEQYFDFCFPYCPENPFIQDLGIPCP
jgi:hypothetical protein